MKNLHRYYTILGLKPGASAAAIKQAYRQLARTWHPDRFVGDERLKQQAEEKFKQIAEAYQYLKSHPSGEETSSNAPRTSTRPTTPEEVYHRAVASAEAEQFADAIADLTKAIRLNPQYLQAYQYRGFLNEKLGYQYRAEADFRKVAELKLQRQTPQKTAEPASAAAPPLWRQTRVLQGDCGAVEAIAVHPRGHLFASGNGDGTIKLWQVKVGQNIYTFRGHAKAVCSLAFSPKGRFLVSASADKTIKLWDLKKREVIRTFRGHGDKVTSVAFSRDGSTLVSGSGDKTVKLWDVVTGKMRANLKGYGSEVAAIAIAPDGNTFASGGWEKSLRIRDLATGKLLRSLRGNSGVLAVAYSPDGATLATGGLDRAATLSSLTGDRQHRIFTGHRDAVCGVTFNFDGTLLASGSWDCTVKLWQVRSDRELCTLQGHRDKVLSLAFSPDGKRLFSSAADGAIVLWQALY